MEEKIETTSVKKSKAPLYISAAIIVSLVAAYFFIPAVNNFLNEAWQVLTSDDETRIKQWVSQFGWVGPLVLVLTMVLQMFLLVIPSLLLMVVSVLAYGPIWGSAIIFASIFTASSVGYFIGRYFGPAIVERLIGEKSEKKIRDFLEDYGFWAVIVTRINPLLSNDAISFVAGILKMGYWRFITATLVGIAPLTIFIAVLGKTTQGLKTGLIWGSIISLILFLAYVWWDKKKRKK
ncbi:TVP38/TMEM64 family protein [Antarcticibacterium sp. 1MA-6-2]|uniref:TVP38/TMEM64 family protein n=1 Tax=Antarcticibacterium sp. 1MA-6-2 TaxID=2908210 RepID=UPI001F3EF254|nr:TVP38/TMEM64 family protein [Antarcticibacterium sp. 1MA-6-2]UJH92621.1 TVP38/TMEM64 family protein [Antarcticibacterium sp. 1MA-6-2]